MRPYCILRQSPKVLDQPTVLRPPEGIDPELLLKGDLLDTPDAPVRAVMNPRTGAYRGMLVDGIVSFFHDDLRAELDRCGVDNVQYFPAELENPEGELEADYSLINIVGRVDAVDRDRSRIDPSFGGDGLGTLKEFEIDPDATRGLKMFRIVHAPALIIISPEIVEAMMQFKPRGVALLPTSKYDGWG